MRNDQNILLIRNLKHAGCSPRLIATMLHLQTSCNTREVLRLLARQRTGLLEKMHATQTKIDCLDYLVFHMKQKHTTSSGR